MKNDAKAYYMFKGLRVFKDIRKALPFFKAFHKKHYYIMKMPQLPTALNREFSYYNYKVNPYKLLCTCPQFYENAARYNHPRDIRRICKHLYHILKQKSDLPYLIELLIENQIAHGPENLIKRKNNNQLVFYGVKNINDQQWFNIYLQDSQIKERFTRLSYNIPEKRWSFGAQPENAELLERQLRMIITRLKQ